MIESQQIKGDKPMPAAIRTTDPQPPTQATQATRPEPTQQPTEMDRLKRLAEAARRNPGLLAGRIRI